MKGLQLKISGVTSAGSLLSAVWLIGRHLWGPGKWTHTEEHTHAHTPRASRLSDVSWLRSEESAADISERRGEAAAPSRFRETVLSRALMRKTWMCVITSPSEAALREEEKKLSHANVKCRQNFTSDKRDVHC